MNASRLKAFETPEDVGKKRIPFKFSLDYSDGPDKADPVDCGDSAKGNLLAEIAAMDNSSETNDRPSDSTNSFVTARFDHPHEPARANPSESPEPSRIQPRRARMKMGVMSSATAAEASSKTWAEQLSEPPTSSHAIADPVAVDDTMPSLAELEELAPLAARHADDIAWHLTQRLQAVERRELDLSEYSSRLHEAEAKAQAWVMERESDFQSRERAANLREAEFTTRLAATAAMEIAAQEEQSRLQATWAEQIKTLEKREAFCAEMEARLHAESYALQAAIERFNAEKQQQEEQFRARRQQWDLLCEQDRTQLDRLQQNILRHRKALETREQQVRALEANFAGLKQEQVHAERLKLETERLRMEAAQERRIATEQRWVAGRLWAKLMDANLVSNDELATVLKQVRQDLELTYRRERESLERVRQAMLQMANNILQPVSADKSNASVLKRPTPTSPSDKALTNNPFMTSKT